MPTNNYNSPSSLLPQTGQMQPPAFMQGMQYYDQMKDYGDMMSLQKMFGMQDAQKGAAELADFQSARPSALASTIATNNATAQTIGGIKHAEMGQKQLDLRKGLSTEDSDVATKIAQNVQLQGDAGMQQLQRNMRFAQIAASLGQSGPASAAQLAQVAEREGIKPDSPVFQSIANSTRTPAQWTAIFQQTNNALQDELLKQREKSAQDKDRELARQRLANEGAAKVAGMKTGVEKQEESMFNDFYNELKRTNPSMPDTQLRAQARQRMAELRYGALGGRMESPEDAAARTAGQSGAKVEGVISMLEAMKIARTPKAQAIITTLRQRGQGKGMTDAAIINEAIKAGVYKP